MIVPTTCGTGSEVTNISIINRTRKGTKMGLVSSSMFADEAALIPGMLETLPYGVFATSSIDAMVHAVESFLSPNACAFSRLFSEKALELILRGWKTAVAKGEKGRVESLCGRFPPRLQLCGDCLRACGMRGGTCSQLSARRDASYSSRAVQSDDV